MHRKLAIKRKAKNMRIGGTVSHDHPMAWEEGDGCDGDDLQLITIEDNCEEHKPQPALSIEITKRQPRCSGVPRQACMSMFGILATAGGVLCSLTKLSEDYLIAGILCFLVALLLWVVYASYQYSSNQLGTRIPPDRKNQTLIYSTPDDHYQPGSPPHMQFTGRN